MSGTITVAYLRNQRDRPSVLKAKLSTLREKYPCKLVIVLEGADDLPVYEVWIGRAAPGLKWEPLLANGKRNSLAFLDLLERDTTGLNVCTYFIIDHDYDGCAGREAATNVYVLPAYSIENYLVADDVVDSILRTDLQVIGDDVEVRAGVIARYRELREQFAAQIEPLCARLFGARNHSVGNVTVRETVMACFDVSILGVTVKDPEALDGLVITELPVPPGSVVAGREFIQMDSSMWIRGKYLYAFFKAFVAHVFDDRRSETPTMFPKGLPSLPGVAAAFDLGRLGARSSLPIGLSERIREWAEECSRSCDKAVGIAA